jgi:16S rRNA (cytosine967-C5)-methyltransferase
MIPAARLSAAIEVLQDIQARRRPATDALKDWGLAHRFAGSGDRAAIASLVYEALRVRASSIFGMGFSEDDADTARAQVLGMLIRKMPLTEINDQFSGARFAPEPLTDGEREKLAGWSLDAAPACVAGDYPEWLEPELTRAFGAGLVNEMQALSARAPVDVRVNTLKTLRAKLLPDLMHFNAKETPYSPTGLRFDPGEGGRGPALQVTEAFIKGQFEIQEEGSQLVTLLSGATEGEQVIDLCAGGGGKTLALSAMMNNQGQIYATDNDARRLAPIHARLERAGVRNVQVRTPRSRDDEPLRGLEGKADLVLIDAPCTGTGTWRRAPDIKWRVRPGALDLRIKEQDAVLARAADFVRPGGRIAYITCSVLPAENDDRIAAFLANQPDFQAVDPVDVVAMAPDELSARTDLVSPGGHGLQFSPLRTGTDGFYVSLLAKRPS